MGRMEDTLSTRNNSPAAAPLVAKTSDGLNLSVQTYGNVGNDEILFIHGLGHSRELAAFISNVSWVVRRPLRAEMGEPLSGRI